MVNIKIDYTFWPTGGIFTNIYLSETTGVDNLEIVIFENIFVIRPCDDTRGGFLERQTFASYTGRTNGSADKIETHQIMCSIKNEWLG